MLSSVCCNHTFFQSPPPPVEYVQVIPGTFLNFPSITNSNGPNTVVVSGQSPSSNNGTYVCSFSSQYETSNYAGRNLWNDSVYTWASAPNKYQNSSTGTYLGAISTIVDGTAKNGEYVQIQVPNDAAFVCKRYTYSGPAGTNNLQNRTSEWMLAGSNNGSTWATLHYMANNATNITTTIDIASNNNTYSYYRFIAMRSGNSGQGIPYARLTLTTTV